MFLKPQASVFYANIPVATISQSSFESWGTFLAYALLNLLFWGKSIYNCDESNSSERHCT